MKDELKQFGLVPLTKKERESRFKLGAIFTLPKISELPTAFSIGHGWIEDQEARDEPDFCGAHGSCGMSELQEGVKLGRRWTFAVAKMVEGGDPDSFGIGIHSVLKAHQRHGAVEEAELSEDEMRLPSHKARRIENYRKELFEKAAKHKKQSFFSVENRGYDSYDAIRACIWKFRNKKQAVAVGVQFGWPLEQYILAPVVEGYGHFMYVTGWDDDGLEAVNSYGTKAGREGVHRITREVINKWASFYGTGVMVDLPREEAERRLNAGIKDTDNWLVDIIKSIATFLIALSTLRRK